MSSAVPGEIDKNFDVSFSSAFLISSRFRVFLSDRSSKKLQQIFYKTNRVEKALQKNRQKIQNRLFIDFFSHVFGRFSVRGVQKHYTRISKNESNPGPFLASDPPTHPPTTGVTDFFFAAFWPLGRGMPKSSRAVLFPTHILDTTFWD
jgi:hypothetical protein